MIRLVVAVGLSAAAPHILHAHPQTATEAVKREQPPTTTPHLTIVTKGKGPHVILIPGLSSPRAVWDGVAPELARTHTLHLVQVRGFGGDNPGDNADPGVIDGIVADLDGYIARQQLKKPAVIGHSMGGLAAMMLAARHPNRVGRLMVVDALPFIGPLFGARDVAAITPQAQNMRAMVLAGPTDQPPVTADPGGIWSITPKGRITVANWARAADPVVTAQAMYEDAMTDMRPELTNIVAKPFTVLYATGAGPRAKSLWEHEYAGSSADLIAIPDSYHFIMLDQPARFAGEIKAFLAR